MTFDIEAIKNSKHRLRLRLAALPIGEKLRILDTLREREMSIRQASVTRDGSGIAEFRGNSEIGADGKRAQAAIGSD